MKRSSLLSKLITASLVFSAAMVFSCRPPDDKSLDPVITRLPINQLYTLEMYGDILQRQHQAMKQLENHAEKFDLTWPYTPAIVSFRAQMSEMGRVIRDGGGEDTFRALAVKEGNSLKEAIKMDVMLLGKLVDYYQILIEPPSAQQDDSENAPPPRHGNSREQQMIKRFLMEAMKHQIIIERHDNIPLKELSEYGRKRYRPKNQ